MKYIEVYQMIRDKILDGSYPAWSQLEGEHKLTEAFGVSRPTIRKAIAKLKQESFLHSRQGSGVFVNPPEFYQDNGLTSLSERINGDINLKNIVLQFETVPADQELAERFKIAEGDELVFYRRMRIINDVPSIIEDTWMPRSLFPDFKEEHCQRSVLQYIEKDCGKPISHNLKTIAGKALNEQEAFLLRCQTGHICLSITHHMYLLHSVLAQYTIETLLSNEVTTVSIR